MSKTHAGEQNWDSAYSPEAWSEDPFALFVCFPLEGAPCSQSCRALSDFRHHHPPEGSRP